MSSKLNQPSAKESHLNKSEVGTSVPTSDGSHQKNQQPKNPTSHPKHQQTQLKISPFWIILWIALSLINIIFGLIAPDHDFLTLFRVGGIALCLLYVAKTFPRDYLLLAAMFTTCISDIILAFNNTSEFGLITFLATQIIHLFRLTGDRSRRPITAFACFSGALILLNLCFSLIPLLFLIVGLYAITLTMNVLASYRWHRQDPHNLLATFAAAGFTLFACCDLCTAVSYLSLVSVLPAFFYVPANFFAWFFYYPSQVLISNSSKLPPEPKGPKTPKEPKKSLRSSKSML